MGHRGKRAGGGGQGMEDPHGSNVPSDPMRVVSLLPSATEILCHIGGAHLLVGRSHECDFPADIVHVPVLTGARTHASGAGASAAIDAQVRDSLNEGKSLYTLDADLLRSLEPDVILTQDLCDVCSIDLDTVRGVASTMPRPPKILSLDPHTIWQVFDDCLSVGEAVGLAAEADRAMVELRGRYWEAVDFVAPYVDAPEVLFLEWMEPCFVGGHWTPELIAAAGGRHSLNAAGQKSRVAAPEEILEAAPERVVICPCGWGIPQIEAELPRLQSQRWWPLLPALLEGSGSPQSRVVLVDGNQMFNRPGPRLVDAFRFLVGWLNERPELIPPRFPYRPL